MVAIHQEGVFAAGLIQKLAKGAVVKLNRRFKMACLVRVRIAYIHDRYVGICDEFGCCFRLDFFILGCVFINGVSMLERTGLPPFVAGVSNQLVLGTRR